ncbi:hypothetical protein NPIL_576361 [Nephila pilipes]|uniref:Uncharacterized protein n=1 Tax=Nephila pilipes TaxID=299642 RepID=A0A8X6T8N6_NEPPI|nr:hypothetical protein NPIL_576361 [Nephila pilipes]
MQRETSGHCRLLEDIGASRFVDSDLISLKPRLCCGEKARGCFRVFNSFLGAEELRRRAGRPYPVLGLSWISIRCPTLIDFWRRTTLSRPVSPLQACRVLLGKKSSMIPPRTNIPTFLMSTWLRPPQAWLPGSSETIGRLTLLTNCLAWLTNGRLWRYSPSTLHPTIFSRRTTTPVSAIGILSIAPARGACS